jgi:FkbM family methyltransferase
MIKKIKSLFLSKGSWLRDWLLTFRFSFLNPHENRLKLILIIPRKFYWIVRTKNSTLLYPRNELTISRDSIIRKYTFKKLVRVEKGDIVCDIGAHVGSFTLAIGKRANKIILFEPDPFNQSLLKWNTKELKNVVLIKNPLWNKNEKLPFILGTSPKDSSFLDADGGERGKIFLDAKRLDSIFPQLQIDKIDFLKLDAEGAEPEVLEGAIGVFEKIRKVAIDCSPERFGQPTVKEVKAILENAHYNIVIRDYMVFGWHD